MYGDNELLSICAAENGYVVKVRGRDKGMQMPKKTKEMPMMPDDRMFVVDNLSELKKFLDEKLPGLVPYSADEEYSNSFTEATQDEHD